ncbi:type II secretion system F family protein [Candidatus Woesearchaeota archaeon]|nr:type II secretion system F family protein [Candidatus Woesearchaeota archaeon]
MLFVVFFYAMNTPTVKIVQREKDINREIVYAGRFIIIELSAGVSLYQGMRNLSRHFPKVGPYFADIVNRIDLGTPIDEAITEAIDISPSGDFRKLMWQVMNSIKTGADISVALSGVIDQITREQRIAVEEYSRRLNPLAMFYMLIAIILPSIGIIMFIIISSFLSLSFGLPVLLLFAGLLGFLQYMFLAIIRSRRPAVEL